MKKPVHVAIFVKGGMVEEVYSDSDDTVVDVFDYDNIEAEADEAERDRQLREAEENRLKNRVW